MLKLTLKANESIYLPETYVPGMAVSVTDIEPGRVRLGLTLDRKVPVLRGEVLLAKHVSDSRFTAEDFELMKEFQQRLLTQCRFLNN